MDSLLIRRECGYLDFCDPERLMFREFLERAKLKPLIKNGKLIYRVGK